MSVTQLFSSNRNPFLWLGLGGWLLTSGENARPQAVSSQANIDASAQRRLQETAGEAQRQRRIEEQIRILVPALHAEELAGTNGPVLTRKAIAALARLREEGIPPDEALSRTARSLKAASPAVVKATAYLRNLFSENSSALTPGLLTKLEAGEDPSPRLNFPPYRP
jgi:hypothetical protein